jgi:hypothetical protein
MLAPEADVPKLYVPSTTITKLPNWNATKSTQLADCSVQSFAAFIVSLNNAALYKWLSVFNILTMLIYSLQIILCSALLALWCMDHHSLEWPLLWHLCIDKKTKRHSAFCCKAWQGFSENHGRVVAFSPVNKCFWLIFPQRTTSRCTCV